MLSTRRRCSLRCGRWLRPVEQVLLWVDPSGGAAGPGRAIPPGACHLLCCKENTFLEKMFHEKFHELQLF